MVLDPRSSRTSPTAASRSSTRPTDISNVVLTFVGRDANSHNLDDLAAMEAQLMKVRPYIRYFHSSQVHQRPRERADLRSAGLERRRVHRARPRARGGQRA
jgi:hypothetical protein